MVLLHLWVGLSLYVIPKQVSQEWEGLEDNFLLLKMKPKMGTDKHACTYLPQGRETLGSYMISWKFPVHPDFRREMLAKFWVLSVINKVLESILLRIQDLLILALSSNSTWLLVGSFLSWIQHLPYLVYFWCMLGGSVEVWTTDILYRFIERQTHFGMSNTPSPPDISYA